MSNEEAVNFYSKTRAELAQKNKIPAIYQDSNVIDFFFALSDDVPLTQETASLSLLRFVIDLRGLTGVPFELNAWNVVRHKIPNLQQGRKIEDQTFVRLKAESPLNYRGHDFHDIINDSKGRALMAQHQIIGIASRFLMRPSPRGSYSDYTP